MTRAYRIGNENRVVSKEEIISEKGSYTFIPETEYQDSITFLADPYQNLKRQVRRELADIASEALDSLTEEQKSGLKPVPIRDRKPLTPKEALLLIAETKMTP